MFFRIFDLEFRSEQMCIYKNYSIDYREMGSDYVPFPVFNYSTSIPLSPACRMCEVIAYHFTRPKCRKNL